MTDEEIKQANEDLKKHGVQIVRKEPVPKLEEFKEEYR
jgi:hypothetical protein